MDGTDANIYQVYVKLLDGFHKAFNFAVPVIPVATLKSRIEDVTSIPPKLQLLFRFSRIFEDHETINLLLIHGRKRDDPKSDCVSCPLFLELSSRLRGGKGGFGSLLRGAATKAGQKTSNFDACRDMSGRRLRHVNAEKKLEEWRAEAEERKLEKMADDYIKKKVKEAVKNGKSSAGSGVEKYVEKYRKDSVKCMEEVERSVREAVKGLKRERGGGAERNESDSKRLKIWLGKKKLGESDSEDDSDEEKEQDDEKSVVIDSASLSDSGKESERSQDSNTIGIVDAGLMCPVSSASGSDEEYTAGAEPSKVERNALVSESTGEKIDNNGFDAKPARESHLTDTDGTVDECKEEFPYAKVSDATITDPVQEESASAVVETENVDKPLNFDDIHSVAELEVLGMERLKTELQARGLKCGGTLHERAARLFLLKTTPLEKLPKKLFAKK